MVSQLLGLLLKFMIYP